MSFMDKVRGGKPLPQRNSAADISLRGLEKIQRFIASGIAIQQAKICFSRKQMADNARTSARGRKKVKKV